jgi:hypothetical protein
MNQDIDADAESESYRYSPAYYLKYDLPGKINRKIYKTHYTIVSYDKAAICFNEPMENRQYRSVIYRNVGPGPESYTFSLCSFSPPGSIPFDHFRKTYPFVDLANPSICINEAIEGILIHLFYDYYAKSWQIATKNAVGGEYHILSMVVGPDGAKKERRTQKTVRQMFLEALCIDELALSVGGPLEELCKNHSYSLVLQHPENPIVLQIERPTLYLVAVYDIYPELNRVVSIPPIEYEEWDCFANSTFLFPKRMPMPRVEDPITLETVPFTYKKICELTENPQNSRETMGWMITHLESGDRCFVQNPTYFESRDSQLIDTLLMYQYLCMHRIDRVGEFISSFPKHRNKIIQYSKIHRDFIHQLHRSYMSRFVEKTGKYISPKFLPYITRIHREIYLQSLSEGKKTVITKDVVRQFMKNLDPGEVLYWLNYERRPLLENFTYE